MRALPIWRNPVGDAVSTPVEHDSCPLSPRELQVVQIACRGASNKDAARQLDIAEGTVKRHLANAFKKLQVDSRLALYRTALAHNWVSNAEPATGGAAT